MNRAILLSLSLHLAVMLFVWLDIAGRPSEPLSLAGAQVTVTLKTLPQEVPPPKPKPAPRPETRLTPAPKPAPRPVPEKVLQSPKLSSKPAPLPKAEVPKPQPKATAKPEAKPSGETAPVPQPRVKPKKTEPQDIETPKDDTLTSLLKTLAETQVATRPDTEKDPDQQELDRLLEQLAEANFEDAIVRQESPQAMTTGEFQALRNQLKQCWNIPIGAAEAEDLRIEILVDMRPDATVARAILQKTGSTSNRFYTIAAENALRALRDPFCERLALPLDKYDLWQQMILVFDPRDML